MNKNRTFAKTTGYALLLMAVIAGFAFGYAFPKIFNPDQLDLIQSMLADNMQLYQLMLAGILVVLLLDILVSFSLYQYFKNDNKKIALQSMILRLVYTLIFGIATYYLSKNLGQLNSSTSIIHNYESFQKLWSIGLIVFGFHLLLVGVLMKLHHLIPKILWYLTILAGASYILVHLLKTTSPQLTELNTTLNNILSLPMALGELGLAIWLVVKGGKTKQI